MTAWGPVMGKKNTKTRTWVKIQYMQSQNTVPNKAHLQMLHQACQASNALGHWASSNASSILVPVRCHKNIIKTM